MCFMYNNNEVNYMSTKKELIKLFENNRNQLLSGQELANQLQVSRTAIWKAIKNLEKEGYLIESIASQGYRLLENSDVLSVEGMARHLNKDILIKVYESIDSTNKELKRLSLENNHNDILVVANQQTQGVGRFSRPFYSPAKTGIYMSLLLNPSSLIYDASKITIQTAVAICKAVAYLTDIQLDIKWVNDLFYNQKKVCGILTEAISDFESGYITTLIIGIGMNITTDHFPEELKNTATSLHVSITRNELIGHIINFLYDEFKQPFESTLNDYKKHMFLLNKTITFTMNHQSFIGNVIDINDKGHLLIQVNDEMMELAYGEVSLHE